MPEGVGYEEWGVNSLALQATLHISNGHDDRVDRAVSYLTLKLVNR
ncbi:hypothetical protein GALL_500740 [mine drainage metagenome]|uniref:Uncharacterized protein n=1 Tax=mine drainage metagenome TaxID=410659 RepID=A0A1J5P9R3_9ZZZZ